VVKCEVDRAAERRDVDGEEVELEHADVDEQVAVERRISDVKDRSERAQHLEE
jgi:hypothetical protein